MRDERPRVLFLINNLGLGGAERVFIKDANALAQSGYDVSMGFLYPHRRGADRLPALELGPEKVVSFGFKNLFDIGGYMRLRRALKENSIQVVYSTLDDANIAARIAKLLAPRVRVYVREANVANVKSVKFKIADLFLNFLSRKIVACSPIVGQTLVPYQPVHKRKIVLLENGVDIPERSVVHGPRKEVTILMVGSLEPKKKHLFLLRSLLRLQDADFAWKLVLVGTGPTEQEIRNFVAEHGLSDKVVLAGGKTREQVAEYYASADIFVYTPQWEGGPNVLLEAMSWGLPCLITRFVGEEKITDGVEGLLFDFGDEKALAEKAALLCRDDKLRARLGKAARERVIRENSTEVHLATLKKILYE
ncbi:MAG TPA: glycosyltransferase [Candidatus Paceibacterota bacterium]|nr:glycosyltransferase [Candidatus Paceibacterota bacterium]